MKKTGILFLSILTFVTFIALPTNVEAETLQDYINTLNKYQDDLNKAQSGINKTEAEIKAAQDEINAIVNQVKQMEKEIEKMKEEIIEYNEKIKEKSLQTKELFQYLQIANGENMYLEYAFGAQTITDFIYRMAIVEQLTEHNNNMIKELEDMIDANKKREQELNEKGKQLTARQNDLNQKINELNGVKSKFSENAISANQQLEIYQKIVQRYKDVGCKPTDVIGVDCAKTNNAYGFYRPIDHGYVTSEFDWRWGTLHQGMDMSNGNPFQTKIYPVANGTIIAKYTDYYGALVIAIEHNYNGKWYTSVYGHMSSFAPGLYVGKQVTHDTYIGYMGESGYAYGPHLHLELADCRLYNMYDPNCSSWDKYTSYMQKMRNRGSKGARDLIYFPPLRVSWNTRS